MSMLSRIAGRIAKLPPAETYDILIERDLKVPISRINPLTVPRLLRYTVS